MPNFVTRWKHTELELRSVFCVGAQRVCGRELTVELTAWLMPRRKSRFADLRRGISHPVNPTASPRSLRPLVVHTGVQDQQPGPGASVVV